MEFNNIIVVGGGTSGWMAAISLASYLPDKRITVIDPASISPIGVGEATTGVVQRFVNDPRHRLSQQDLFRHCDTTLKLGVWYKDWQGAGTDYPTPIDAPFRWFPHTYGQDGEDFYALAAADGQALGDIQIHAILMRLNKTDLIRQPDGAISDQYADPSCHFDALQFAAWLKRVAPSRENIVHVDDVVTSFDQDATTGHIRSVTTEQGQTFAGDFFLDCTGFRRQLLQPAYTPAWIDYSRHIRVDSAIPFFTPHDDAADIPVFTAAQALRHGWMWRLPTQSRMGNGYVYSSSYVSDENAVRELQQAGFDVGETPRIIRFQPGRFKSQWQGNVCALGLAGGFLEPLEATTIHITSVQIKALAELYLPFYTSAAAAVFARDFNRLMQSMYDDFVDFISIHYHAGREDSEFWRDYQRDDSITATNLERREKWQYRFPVREDLTPINTSRLHLVAGMPVWMPTLSGLGYLQPRQAQQFCRTSPFPTQAQENAQRYLRMREVICRNPVSHRDAIAYLRGESRGTPAAAPMN